MTPLSQALDAIGAGSRAGAHDSIEFVTGQLALFREERDWGRFHTPKNLAVSIMIEAGELLEHFQWIGDEEIPGYVAQHRADVAEELADVAIYVMQLAEVVGISLADALRDKLALNAERYPLRVSRGSHAKHTQLTTKN
ncbi:MAG TPA: nucleotide pyrophosphohydrolase [Solirubrobacteraceae bacterium]|nr:nucleotide pyrophosphohydrolase [Solirubrobacteraceae bacterium]